MKTSTIVCLVIGAGLLVTSCASYNNLVNLREDVNNGAAQTQNVLQRQADLIPNMANTVKGAAGFETKALTDVIDARSRATHPIVIADGKQCAAVTAPERPDVPKCNPSQLNDDQLRQFTENSRALMSFNVNALREAYPNLKSVGLFANLMVTLEGSQNRITVERMKWQRSIASYNKSVQRIPGSIVANVGGFKTLPYFEADASAQRAPEVKFN